MKKYAIIGVRSLIPGSSMVEQEAVNFEVAGSSPVPGAIQRPCGLFFAHKKTHISRFARSIRVWFLESSIQI